MLWSRKVFRKFLSFCYICNSPRYNIINSLLSLPLILCHLKHMNISDILQLQKLQATCFRNSPLSKSRWSKSGKHVFVALHCIKLIGQVLDRVNGVCVITFELCWNHRYQHGKTWNYANVSFIYYVILIHTYEML